AGNPLCWDPKAGAVADATRPDVAPALVGEVTLPDGRRAVPAFEPMANRYLDDRHAPDNVAATCGLPAERIRRLAAEIAHAAFAEEVVLDVAWTDWAGRRHEKMVGRPVAIHAMR